MANGQTVAGQAVAANEQRRINNRAQSKREQSTVNNHGNGFSGSTASNPDF
jgi:hypothetical protein